MEGQKSISLQLEFKAVSGGPSNASLAVEVEGSSEKVELRGSLKFSLTDVTLQSTLHLAYQSKPPFSTFQSFGTLFGGKLTGKVDKWFHLKSPNNAAMKIRLALQLSNASLKKPSTKPLIRKSIKKSKFPCPFLEAIAGGGGAFSDFLKNREPTGNTVKLLLEPESPVKNEAGEEFSVPLVEDLDVNYLTTLQGTELKSVVKSLCEDAKHLQVFAQQLPDMREQLWNKVKERRDLEKLAEKTTENFKKMSLDKEVEMQALLAHRKALAEQLESLKNKLRVEELEVDKLQGTHTDLTKKFLVKKLKKLRADDNMDILNAYKEKANEMDQRKTKIEKQVKESLKRFADETKLIKQENEKISSDLSTVNQELARVKDSLRTIQEKNKEDRSRMSSMKANLQNLNPVYEQSSQDFIDHSAVLKDELSKLEDFAHAITEQDSKIQGEFQEVLAAKESSVGELAEIENSNTDICIQVNDLKRRCLDSSAQLITMEHSLSSREDLTELVDSLVSLKKIRKSIRSDILADLDKGTDILLEESEKLYQKSTKCDTMIDMADNADEELGTLMHRMGTLRRQKTKYMPANNDPVDAALAELINNRKEPLPVEFVREGPGVYSFGNKKVNTKIENGRILMRSGTSFVAFDDFVQQHGKKKDRKVGFVLGKAFPSSKHSAVAKAFIGLGKKK